MTMTVTRMMMVCQNSSILRVRKGRKMLQGEAEVEVGEEKAEEEMTGCGRRWRHCRGKIEGLVHRHTGVVT